MYKERIKKLRKELGKSGLKFFIVTNIRNCLYLTGFTGSEGVVLITPTLVCLIVDFRYIEQAQEEAKNTKVIKREGALHLLLRDVLKKYKNEEIAFESDSITFKKHKEIKKSLPQNRLVPTLNVVEGLRAIKYGGEIALIEKAVRISDEVFKHICDFIKHGRSEINVAAEIEHVAKRKWSSCVGFDTIVLSGERTSLPHGAPSQDLLKNGIVLLDFGCVFSGYNSDITRTIFLGKATAKQKEIYNIVLEAQKIAIKSVSPGVKVSCIDKVARDYIADKGYSEYFGHSTGHGVGLDVHELPAISSKSDEVLQSGMIFTIEPGIYIPGWGGIRIEDMVEVTDNGCKIITKSSKEIIEIL
ncbi:MAG: aminopeptidase P family protein [bacterium]|nr:aminopeptidase P family protein [bacterium]